MSETLEADANATAVPSVRSLSPAFIPSPQKPMLSYHSQLRWGELRTTFRQHGSEKVREEIGLQKVSFQPLLPGLFSVPPVPSLALRLLLLLSFLLTSARA